MKMKKLIKRCPIQLTLLNFKIVSLKKIILHNYMSILFRHSWRNNHVPLVSCSLVIINVNLNYFIWQRFTVYYYNEVNLSVINNILNNSFLSFIFFKTYICYINIYEKQVIFFISHFSTEIKKYNVQKHIFLNTF